MTPNSYEIRKQIQIQVNNLNAQIAPLTERVIAAKRQMNSLVPIFRIPSETLSAIFRELLKIYWKQRPKHGIGWESSDDDDAEPRNFHPVPWIAVTYVCHVWREVAINDSRLWDHLKIHVADNFGQRQTRYSPYLIQEVLTRAGELPLVVELDGQPNLRPENDFILDPLLQNFHRIDTLIYHIMGGRFQFMEDYPEFLSGPYTILRNFELYAFPSSDEIPFVAVNFTCTFPNLKRVTLNGVALVSVPQFLWPPVTEIAIEYRESQGTLQYPKFVEKLQEIEMFDNLRDLELCFSGLKFHELVVPPAQHAVTFPRLTHLRVVSDSPEGLDILKRISTPPRTNLCFRLITCSPDANTEKDGKPFLNEIAAYLAWISAEPYWSIFILANSHDDTEDPLLSFNAGSTRTYFEVEFRFPNLEVIELVEAYCDVLPVSGVTTLCLEKIEPDEVSQCTRMFSSLKEVEKLELQVESYLLFVEALGESSSQPHTVLFPKLRELCLDDEGPVDVYVNNTDAEVITRWLRRRSDGGYRLVLLDFNCPSDLGAVTHRALTDTVGKLEVLEPDSEDSDE